MPKTVPITALSGVENRYSTPFIHTGKPPLRIPRGSTKSAELAKNKWFVEFYYHEEVTGESTRYRLSRYLNRIKDYGEKLDAFNKLLSECTEDLANGGNPNRKEHTQLQIAGSPLLYLNEAIDLFIKYHVGKGNRPKTISTYKSKLKLFREHVGNVAVRSITDYHITEFLNHCETKRSWTGVTYNFARIVLNNFFVYLKRYKQIDINPATGLEGRKEIKTESHQVFADDDFVKIMKWLRRHDPYCLLFVQTIYYTCIRPKELRNTQLKYIDLINSRIIIPAHIAKNKKAIPVQLDPTLKSELLKLKINDYPVDYYLFGDVVNIVGKTPIGVNTPYYRFQICLKLLGLKDKNYTLYSFKHLSNVRKYLAGWTIAEICAANRHSSLVETETYLKDLIKFIPITKTVPII